MSQNRNTKERIKLDEIVKSLFSVSKPVLLNLLNAIFEENFTENEVEIDISNNEFVLDSLDIIQGDMLFKLSENNKNKHYYHIEFQTKNDSTMVLRMLEYGYIKGKELLKTDNITSGNINTLYFPKQKVIFFEENLSIKDNLELNIVFPGNQLVLYTVDVMKYWEYDDKKLIDNKMYSLLPLQLFLLRKDLIKASDKNDINKIKSIAVEAKTLAKRIANDCKELFENNKILGSDFHTMLLSIQNLIEYLNNNYFKDETIEEEVTKMTKTLYDPEVEKNGEAKLLLKQLKDIFPNISIEYEEKIKKSSTEVIENIGLNFYKMKSISELDKYLN